MSYLENILKNYNKISNEITTRYIDSLKLSSEQFSELMLFLQKNDISIVDDYNENLDIEEDTIDYFEKNGCMDDLVKVYINEISKEPLLSQEEEKQLFIQYANGDLKARETLLKSNLRLVVFVAKKYSPGNNFLSILDLIQDGNIGLMKAIDKFDISKGYRFSTYAEWWIRQGIVRGMQNTKDTIKIPINKQLDYAKIKKIMEEFFKENGREPSKEEISKHLNISIEMLESIIESKIEICSFNTLVGEDKDVELEKFIFADFDTEEFAERSITLENIYEVMKRTLTKREQLVILLRTAQIDGKAWTLQEIGDKIHVTREGIRQIEKSALKKLTEAFRRTYKYEVGKSKSL